MTDGDGRTVARTQMGGAPNRLEEYMTSARLLQLMTRGGIMAADRTKATSLIILV